MAAYQGTYFSRTFQVVSQTTGLPVDITGWTFQSEIRVNVADAAPLVTLLSSSGDFSILDAPKGRFLMGITAVNTALLPLGKVVFDVLRTDAVPGPVWLFGGSFKVKEPVTR